MLRDLLQAEHARRRAANARYSLRSFARDLDIDHATLSQILRGHRRAPSSWLRRCGQALGLNREEIAAMQLAEQLPDPESVHRQEQLRHWVAEAQAVMREPHHHQLLQLLHEPDFCPDVPRLAARLKVSGDTLNIGIARLARLGLLTLQSPDRWEDTQQLGLANATTFRRRALARIRELAPQFPQRLPRR